MKKLHFTKKTISSMENLHQLTGGAAGTQETRFCDTQEECTYSAVPGCPITSSRATESRSRSRGGN
ncbi:hypothetical protein [uncultured Kordia sp.]|uniref:hypothetical protein n=1 Tax=uncultured Kordia sp. TaxID=507699 RepID=UPI00261A4176|nr:hypothetical protein [uncultured Kordia sp.]